ncbi:MAG: PRD domain-containing protein [Erysipelotrichaceae bacterium]|nr:PRD domain-containing protein [Erysipelotrichaceae bacterium]
MRISKILNNNTVIVNENNNEVVLVGRGIAFKKRPGDPINPAQIEKRFGISDIHLNARFQEIIVSLPVEEISIVDQIINMARMTLSKKISDSIYPALCDHIHSTLINYQKGIKLVNELLFDITHFYPDEYAIGLKALDLIEEETGVRFNNDEAGFIALHLVNAETENGIGTDKIQKSTKIIEETMDIVRNFFDKEIDENSITYYRFINHLRYFAQRITQGVTFSDDSNDEALLGMMKKTYQESYLCAMNISGFVKGRYNVDIGSNELLYLIIHIQRAIFNN